MKLLKRLSQSGDTIVEVMISLSVLAVVLAAAYAVTTRSLQAGLNAKYRGEALTYAQAQLEIIKNADNAGLSNVGAYKLSNPFCIDPSSGKVQSVDSNSKTCPLPIGQTDPLKQLPYSIVDSYNSTTKTFTAKVQWQAQNNQTDQTTIYYKAHNSFVTTPGGSCPLCVSQTQTAPPDVGISFSANPTSVDYNSNSKLTWTTTNATSCSATSNPSGVWSGSKATSSPGGGEQVGPLTTTTDFTLTCTNGGSTANKSLTVTVAPPPMPTATTGSATSVTYSSATLNGTVNPNGQTTTYYFQYGTTINYGSVTPNKGAGSGSANQNASESISVGASTTYHFRVCATDTYGTVCGNDATFTSGVAPPSSYPPSSYPPSSYPPSSYPPSSYPPSSYPPSSYSPSNYPPSSYPPSSYPPSTYCFGYVKPSQIINNTYPSFGSIYGLPTPPVGYLICGS